MHMISSRSLIGPPTPPQGSNPMTCGPHLWTQLVDLARGPASWIRLVDPTCGFESWTFLVDPTRGPNSTSLKNKELFRIGLKDCPCGGGF